MRRAASQEIVNTQAEGVFTRGQVLGNCDEVSEKVLRSRNFCQIDGRSQWLTLEQFARGRAHLKRRQGQCAVASGRRNAERIFKRRIDEDRLSLAEPPGIEGNDVVETAHLAANLNSRDGQCGTVRCPARQGSR